MGLSIAIVGASGNVGREILTVMAERRFEADRVAALARAESEGRELAFGGRTVKVQPLEDFDFSGTDIAFFAVGSGVARAFAPKAAKAGAVVIDNSSHFRLDPDVPLVVPEVNADALSRYVKKNIIANPNCSAAQLAVALKPLHDAATIKRVVVATYQSVSGAGREAMDELFQQTRSVYSGALAKPKAFPRQIAFNLFPQVGDFDPQGVSVEEGKMASEIAKIVAPGIRLTATCVRVPVFIGHSEAVNVEFTKPLSAEDAREILRQAPGIILEDETGKRPYATPVDCVGESATFVSRVRKDPTVKNGLNFWVVSDNLRKGAALNAVQIAEILAEKFLKR